MKTLKNLQEKLRLLCLTLLTLSPALHAQPKILNTSSRHLTSLNGIWEAIIDPTGSGEWKQVWQEKKPQSKTDFVEYSFNGGPELNVPGDFNSQLCELTYFEGIVWYKKQFNHKITPHKRLFLHFGAVNYLCEVYLNGVKIGVHEGGFTPFQFEITQNVSNGSNRLIIKVDNKRLKNGLPGIGYDWFNYGGITRDVDLIETNETFIEDYFIQLKKGSLNTITGWVKLNEKISGRNIYIEIPELKLNHKTTTNEDGIAYAQFILNVENWSPKNPKLYKVKIKCNTDSIVDDIGFRCIETKDGQVLLNGNPIFLSAVNIHEENPYKKARAYSPDDAKILLDAAKELGCNLVRLAHYPHSENMVKEAEKMGIMVWDELPVYQHIEFSDSLMPTKLEKMMKEMVQRDKNRCGVVVWSLSNETYPSTPHRNEALVDLTKKCKTLDSTRLIVHAINTQGYKNNEFNVWDPLYVHSDLLAINEYIGWYIPWQGEPSDSKWNISFPDKPIFISEFGGEAKSGTALGPIDEAASWSEEYQERIYKKQVEMFAKVPNLCGVCPWLLFDYRSLGRMNQLYQNGYNRKGLLSENGEKKKAWYLIHEYYKNK